MAKYELELEEAAARQLIHDLREGLGDKAARALADALEEQIPIPVPVKIGAVVRTNGATDNRLTSGNNYFIRWAYDNATTSPWIEAGNHEEPYRTDAIGRITEVLSPGVDL